MPKYQLKISQNLYNEDYIFEGEIKGAEDWGRTVTRDFNDRLFRTKGEYKFTAHEGLYALLVNHINNQGVCEALTGRIYWNNELEWKGDILPQDFELDLVNRAAEAQVLDASWSAKFNNSNEQKVFLRSTESRNGTGIKQCDYNACQFWDPAESNINIYLANRRICFRIYDVFAFLVRYYSDDTVTFASDFFQIGGDGDQYYITTGQEIRLADGSANPEVSFKEVFDEMNKKCNLWIIVEGTIENPILRIEPATYVFDNTKILDIEDPEQIVVTTDLDQLYTIIKVGGNASEYDGSTANYPTIRFQSWNDEEYNVAGACQFENNKLDLVSSWIIDTNTIEKTLPVADGGSNDDTNDNSIFLVEIDPTAPDYDAFKFDTDYTGASTVRYIYNYNLTNERVILNWFNGIFQEMRKEIGETYYVYVDTPTATTVSQFSLPHELDFTNDSTAPAKDVDDIYTTAGEAGGGDDSGEFKSPVDALWDYTVSVRITNGAEAQILEIYGYVYEDNSRGTQIATIRPYWHPLPTSDRYFIAGETKTITFTSSNPSQPRMFLATNNVVVWKVDYLAGVPGDFDIVSASAEMEIIAGPQADSYNAPGPPLIYIFDIGRHAMSRADFDILDQGLGYVRIIDSLNNQYYDTWAQDAFYNSEKGILTGKFIGSRVGEYCWILEDGYWNDNCYWLDTEWWLEPDLDYFMMTVDTTKAGSPADTFILPTTGTGYDYWIDWGDGNVETITSDASQTHVYSVGGSYQIKILGDFPRIYFNDGGDRLKLSSIDQWGNIGWTSMNNAFAGCFNVTNNFSDAPDLRLTTDCRAMFYRAKLFTAADLNDWNTTTITDMGYMFGSSSALHATIFNGDINDWDVSNVTTFIGMFVNNDTFNQDISGWDTSSATDMSVMFSSADAFNQDISTWNMSNVTTIATMFRDAVAFDQNIGNWNLPNLSDATNFLNNTSISTANYDALLTGWTGWLSGVATKFIGGTVTFSAGTSTYTGGSDAEDARTYLDITKGWTITDGGAV